MRLGPATSAPKIIFLNFPSSSSSPYTTGDEGDSVSYEGEPEPYLISAPSLRDYGLLFQYLEDRLLPPDDAPDDWVPDLNSNESEAIFAEDFGMGILLYIGLRRDYPEIRLHKAISWVTRLDEDARESVRNMALVRDEQESTYDPLHWKDDKHKKKGEPLNKVNFGKLYESALLIGFEPNVMGSWTLAQLESKLRGGTRDPIKEGVPISPADAVAYMQRMQDPVEFAKDAALRGEPLPDWVTKALAEKAKKREREERNGGEVREGRETKDGAMSVPGVPGSGIGSGLGFDLAPEGMRLLPNGNPNPIPGVPPPYLPELIKDKARVKPPHIVSQDPISNPRHLQPQPQPHPQPETNS